MRISLLAFLKPSIQLCERASEVMMLSKEIPREEMDSSLGEDVTVKIVDVMNHDLKVWELYNPPELELDENWNSVLMATT